jgi:hypothetical protein
MAAAHAHQFSTSTSAAGAHSQAADEASPYTVMRRAAADILGAVGFGGIISGFTALATYATTTVAPAAWYTNVVSNVASPAGLLLTAAVAGTAGVLSMLGSSVLKANLESEQHCRDRCARQQEPQVVVVPMPGMAIHHQPVQAVASGINYRNDHAAALLSRRGESLHRGEMVATQGGQIR